MGDESKNELVDRIVESYRVDLRTQHLDSIYLPSRTKAIELIELMRRIIFPGFFDDQRVTSKTVRQHVASLLGQATALLFAEVSQALQYEQNRGQSTLGGCNDVEGIAQQVTAAFMQTIPDLRRLLATDVQAAFDGDPAAVNTDEAIFCYPGIDAIFIHRMAHELYKLEVPLLPRIMSEYAHNETGIDIHPGAQVGESFFIDHGTGVVIGETTQIGNRVKLYQTVTLGALSTKGGQAWRGRKRHPTIEDDVTIYPNATILGGQTVVGRGCVINGSVFLTHSVPPGHTVHVKHPRPEFRPIRVRKNRDEAAAPGNTVRP